MKCYNSRSKRKVKKLQQKMRSCTNRIKSTSRLEQHFLIDSIWCERFICFYPKSFPFDYLIPRQTSVVITSKSFKTITCYRTYFAKNWKEIERHPKLSKISHEPPALAFNRHKSAKDLLVRADLSI